MASSSSSSVPKGQISVTCIGYVTVKGEKRGAGKRFIVETAATPAPVLSAPQRSGVFAVHLQASDLSYALGGSSGSAASRPSPSPSPSPSDVSSIQSSPGVDKNAKWFKVYDFYKQPGPYAKKFANDISEVPKGTIVVLGLTDTAIKQATTTAEIQMFYDGLGLLGATADVAEKFPVGYRTPWIFVGVRGAPKGSAYISSAKPAQELKVTVEYQGPDAEKIFTEVSREEKAFIPPGKLPIKDIASSAASDSASAAPSKGAAQRGGGSVGSSSARKATAKAKSSPVAKSKLLLHALKSPVDSDVALPKSPKNVSSPRAAVSPKATPAVKRAASEAGSKSPKKQRVETPQRQTTNTSSASAAPSKGDRSPRRGATPKSPRGAATPKSPKGGGTPKVRKSDITENWLDSYPYLKMVQERTGFQTHEDHANSMGYPQVTRWQHEVRRFYPTVEIEMKDSPPEEFLFKARELVRNSARELGAESAHSKRFRENGQLALAIRALKASIPTKGSAGSINGFRGVVETAMSMKPLMRSKILTHYPFFHYLTLLLSDMAPKFAASANVSGNQQKLMSMLMKGVFDLTTEAIRNLPRVCRMLIDGEAEVKKILVVMKKIRIAMAAQDKWTQCKTELEKAIAILEDPEKLQHLNKNLEDIRIAREEKKIVDPQDYYNRKKEEAAKATKEGGDGDVEMAEGDGAVADPSTTASETDPADPIDTTIEATLASKATNDTSHPRVIAGGHGWLVIDKPTGWEAQCRRKHADMSVEEYTKNKAENAKMDLQYYIIHELSEHLPFLKEMRLMPPVAKKSVGTVSHFGQLFPLDADTSGLVLLGTRPSSLPLLQNQAVDASWRSEYVALVMGQIPLKQCVRSIAMPLACRSLDDGSVEEPVAVESFNHGTFCESRYMVKEYFKQESTDGKDRGFTLLSISLPGRIVYVFSCWFLNNLNLKLCRVVVTEHPNVILIFCLRKIKQAPSDP